MTLIQTAYFNIVVVAGAGHEGCWKEQHRSSKAIMVRTKYLNITQNLPAQREKKSAKHQQQSKMPFGKVGGKRWKWQFKCDSPLTSINVTLESSHPNLTENVETFFLVVSQWNYLKVKKRERLTLMVIRLMGFGSKEKISALCVSSHKSALWFIISRLVVNTFSIQKMYISWSSILNVFIFTFDMNFDLSIDSDIFIHGLSVARISASGIYPWACRPL